MHATYSLKLGSKLRCSSLLFGSFAAVAAAAITLTPAPAEAKKFRNAYLSFEIPDKWDCVLEQTEWVCRPAAPDLAQQAIIILTAKEVGPSDSLPAYEQHLKMPRSVASRTGMLMPSQILKVDNRMINSHPWVDGMHMASEVPNYFTRYLATTKDKIAILVTFSAHKLHYTKFSMDFFKAIESLVVVASPGLLRGNGGAGGGGGDTFGAPGGGGFGFEEPLPEEGSGGDGGGGLGETTQAILGIALILAAVGVYLLVKRGGGSKKKRR